MSMVIGALISNYIQNPKFRTQVNTSINEFIGQGIDALNKMGEPNVPYTTRRPVAADAVEPSDEPTE